MPIWPLPRNHNYRCHSDVKRFLLLVQYKLLVNVTCGKMGLWFHLLKTSTCGKIGLWFHLLKKSTWGNCTCPEIHFIYTCLGKTVWLQARILAPDIGQCQAKTQVLSDKAASKRAQLYKREIKNLFISYRRLKTHKHSVSIGISCSGFFVL